VAHGEPDPQRPHDPGRRPPLSGDVEADETFFGGKPRAAEQRAAKRTVRYPRQAGGRARKPKVSVFGAVERGGRVRAVVVPDSSAQTLGPYVKRFVLPSSVLFTDEWKGYNSVGLEYRRITASGTQTTSTSSGDVHTNTIEGFWSTVKRGIDGNYHSVSAKWLQGYLNEFVWRYNRRYVVRQNGKRIRRLQADDRAMFLSLIDKAVVTALPWS
jgi:transposase-like protein